MGWDYSVRTNAASRCRRGGHGREEESGKVGWVFYGRNNFRELEIHHQNPKRLAMLKQKVAVSDLQRQRA